MKEGIHPEYRDVCFVDLSNGFKFVTRSCANSKEKIKLDDGREMPLFKLETTSESHPFYTGTQKSIDSLGGRVEKFRNKFSGYFLRRQLRLPFPFSPLIPLETGKSVLLRPLKNTFVALKMSRLTYG
jgi:large subunit ribosomal protein L31